MNTSQKITRALLSVSDKTGLVELAKFLVGNDIELISTGGTYKALKDAGIAVKDVSSVTGSPEMMGGRVKTLHPKIHGGLLADRDKDDHIKAMQDHGIGAIDLLVVNLYPFAKTLESGADYETIVENIDIGGPAMLRGAAKNHAHVAVIVDPNDYEFLQGEIKGNEGGTCYEFRQSMAAKAYGHTAHYDAMIANWLSSEWRDEFPHYLSFAGVKQQGLRYGENPHQKAAFYRDTSSRAGIATAKQLGGKELSYNNLNDTDAAFELVAEFTEPAVAIIKHANPCGVASAATLSEAYDLALRCDPVSAFGGIIAVNQKLDVVTAEKIAKLFAEVVIAPEIDPKALDILTAKKNLRVLVTGAMPKLDEQGLIVKSLAGGLLVQTRDNGRIDLQDLKIVTKRAPTEQELKDLLFAWRVAKHVKSNAIVYVKDGATVGIGAGQMSRVDSARIAAHKAVDFAKATGLAEPLTIGSVVASDAFFPFADGLISASDAGVTAVIQPGGSMRDQEVIDAADERNLAMVFTGMRHFRH